MTETTQEFIRPPSPPGPIKWVRDNLFNTWFNSILTIILIPLVGYAIFALVKWVFISADWTPVFSAPLLFVVGQYPRPEIWRVFISLAGIMFLLGASWGRWGGLLRPIAISGAALFAFFALLPVQHNDLSLVLFSISSFEFTVRIYLGVTAALVFAGYWLGRLEAVKKWHIVAAWGILPMIAILLTSGFGDSELLPAVTTTAWGGLLVTILLAAGGILLSIPIGLFLALGRRSTLPVLKVFSTIMIEGIRGVPLVTILFMFSFILTLLLPPEARIDRIVRALMAVTFFSAAYTAENIRGGLQAVHPGQIEAAKAVGMSGVQTMVFIVLPQAIRAVLPAIVGQFIALFKDTTLVVIVGINDLLGIGRAIVNSEPAFLQLQLEVYIFIAVIYMIFSYLMSMASRRLETTMGVQNN
ncbi:MAG: amino acid ABC transporter permease [Anaerolineae bacterium]|nr:amino acid ABC transporter permease [Anaerolineae bacterium]